MGWNGIVRRMGSKDEPAGSVQTQTSAATCHDCHLAIEFEDVLEVV